MAIPSSGPLSLSALQTEFGGPSPIDLKNYYRVALLSQITAGIVTSATDLSTMKIMESGAYATDFSGGIDEYIVDWGTLLPQTNLDGLVTAGMAAIVSVGGVGNVLQTTGTTSWGDFGVRSYGYAAAFKLQPSTTYTVQAQKRLLNDPTNSGGNAPRMYVQLALFNSQLTYIASYTVASPQITTADGWQTIGGAVTTSTLEAFAPTAVYARVMTYDNLYDSSPGGIYTQIGCDVTTQTAFLTVTGASLSGGSGFTTLYDTTGGADTVWALSGGSWSIDGSRSISELGAPRQSTNPYNGVITRLGDNGEWLVISRSSTAGIPTSGAISLSNFYGSHTGGMPVWSTGTNLGSFARGGSFSATLSATSPDGFTVTYTTGPLPSGLVFDGAHTISGTVFPYTTPTTVGFFAYANDGFISVLRNFTFNAT